MCTGTHTHSHSPGVLPPLPLSSSSQGSFGEQQQLWSRWLIVQAIKETCQTERDDPEGIARMGAGPLRDWRCVSQNTRQKRGRQGWGPKEWWKGISTRSQQPPQPRSSFQALRNEALSGAISQGRKTPNRDQERESHALFCALLSVRQPNTT